MRYFARRSAMWIAGLATLALVGFVLLFASFDLLTLLLAGGDIAPCFRPPPAG